MFEIVTSSKFLKDLKLLKKRSTQDLEAVKKVIANWECHVKPDLLLIWDEDEQINLLQHIRTGTHSDLF